MPRLMSFSMTTDRVRDWSKTVTRRMGWKHLRSGDELIAVEKAMGLRKGEKVKRIALIRVVSISIPRLDSIDQRDVIREGFPGMKPKEFVEMFCKANHCKPEDCVRRIHFEYIEAYNG